MVDLSVAECGDIVRVIDNKDTRRYSEMAKFVGKVVTLREPVVGSGAWYIYEDEGTCHYSDHKYRSWFWYPSYLEYVEMAPLNIDDLGALLFG